MNIDAVLTALSFVSFLALLVAWVAAPLRAQAPVAHAVVETAPPAAVAA
jgi:hypothetical protein